MPPKQNASHTYMEIVRGLPLLEGMTETEKSALLGKGRIFSYPRKTALFLQGDAVDSFYIICAGTVQLVRSTPDGHDVTTGLFTEGDALSEKEIFTAADRHSLSAMAVDGVVVLKLPAEALKQSIASSEALARNVLASLARAATLAEREVEQRVTMTAAQMISCYLQHMCVAHDFKPEGFTLPYKKSLIASRLGMELETFSRALPKLREHGISVSGPRVTFEDFAAIDAHACARCSVNEFCTTYKSLRGSADGATAAL